MWLQRLLLLSSCIVFLHIPTSSGQLGNVTRFEKGIDYLDFYDPHIYSPNTTRIVGGRRVKIRQVPWQVAVFNSNYFICGGSIISIHWVLTAAHCVAGGGSFSVRAGSSYWSRGGQYRRARTVIRHRRYNSYTTNRDIAMIRVRKRFRITSTVKPVALAKTRRRLPKRFFISGWGTLREGGRIPRHLRGVTIRKVRRPTCRKRYSPAGITITSYMICAASPGKDSCQGDSGGPLTRRNIQYGIVSFGIGCARRNYPGVYTNTRKLNGWIQRVVRRYGGRKPRFK